MKLSFGTSAVREQFNLYIALFAFLWVLILLPKAAQFAVLFAIAAGLVLSNKARLMERAIPTYALFFILGFLVHGVSILAQCASGVADLDRLLAAINTLLIWVIAIIFHLKYRFHVVDRHFVDKVYRLALLAFAILIAVYCLSLIYDHNIINVGGYQLHLKRLDYLDTGTTTRFAGLMETVLGPSHMYSILAPILVVCARGDYRKTLCSIAALLLGLYVVVQTHSRIGLVVCTAICILSVGYLLCTVGKYRVLFQAIAAISIATLLIFAVLNIPKIMELMSDLFFSRAGSNSARFGIYENSIEVTLEKSPIVGMGIKYMLGDFPYGSHCTYIGIFYKTGFLGSVFFLLGFLGMLAGCFSTLKRGGYGIAVVLSVASYFGLLIFADLDGSNWVICLAFATWGLLSNESFITAANHGQTCQSLAYMQK